MPRRETWSAAREFASCRRLPWKFDFSDGEVPVTWVGARYRNIVREVDGNKVMVKVTTIPKGTRSQLLMGPVDLHDYTIQADVRGANGRSKGGPDASLAGQKGDEPPGKASSEVEQSEGPSSPTWLSSPSVTRLT